MTVVFHTLVIRVTFRIIGGKLLRYNRVNKLQCIAPSGIWSETTQFVSQGQVGFVIRRFYPGCYYIFTQLAINCNRTACGKIIGYQLAPSDQTLTLYDGSSSSPLTNISASFITPSNGKILVELSGLRLSSNSQSNPLIINRDYYIGLSSSTGSFVEVKPFRPIFSLPIKGSGSGPGSYEVSTKWVITNLTPGQLYTYYFYCYAYTVYDINSALKFSSISDQTAVIMTSLP